MEKRSVYTIKTLLEELKENLVTFKNGMIFETIKSIFPTTEVPKNKRIVEFNKISFTKPLACNKKDKENYLKEDSPVANFFKENKRGDFLQVVEVKNEIAYCKNLSLKEEISKKYYKDELIKITYDDLISGNIKLYRRNIQKFF